MTLPADRLKAVYDWRVEKAGRRPIYDWGSGGAVKQHDIVWNVTLETDLMDRLIDWKIRSPSMTKCMKTSATTDGDGQMIRQFTIELRVNYADSDKNDTMRSACAAAARHMFATANLLADGTNPDIAIYSDDWFAGKEEINLMQDVIQQGLDETTDTVTEGEISSELMAAVRDSV